MKRLRHTVRGRGAYTLLELLVGVTTASAIFAIILTSGVAIYRSCSAADDFSVETNAQLRSIDYVTRDFRNATAVTIPSGGATLTLTLPDCYAGYDGGMPTSEPVDPVIVDGVPVYGDPSVPVVLNYYVSGGVLIREQFVTATSQTTRLVVATGVNAFSVTMMPLSTAARVSIQFTPKPHPGNAALRPAAAISATVAARMLRIR